MREIFPIKSYIGTFAGEEFQINRIISQFSYFLTKIWVKKVGGTKKLGLKKSGGKKNGGKKKRG